MEFWAFKFPAILFLVKTSNSLVSAEPSAAHFIADQDMWENCGSSSNSFLTQIAGRLHVMCDFTDTEGKGKRSHLSGTEIPPTFTLFCECLCHFPSNYTSPNGMTVCIIY